MTTDRMQVYRRFRDARDPQGDLAWATKVSRKVLRGNPEPNVEDELELSPEERILWRLLRLPRRYVDVEGAGLLPLEQARAALRGFTAVELISVVEPDEVSGKPILPIELERLRMELAGAPMPAPKRGKLKARVYRPDIGIPQAALPVVEAHAPKPTPVAASPAGPTAAPQPLDPAEAERKASLEAAYAAMSGQNHYAFLGLETKADDGAVRSAYMRRARDLHPDSIAGGNLATHTDIVDKVDALFKRLQEAHGILSNPDSRAAYDRQIASGGTGAPEKGKKVRRPEEAAVLYGKAEHLVKKKDWLSAETHYRTALELDGEDPRIAVGLAWSIFMNPDRKESERAQEASKRLKDALTKFKTADAAFKLGVVLRALNDEEGAQRHFQTALKLDPKHIEAARERRLFEMRGQKAAEDKEAEKGLFGRMFKR